MIHTSLYTQDQAKDLACYICHDDTKESPFFSHETWHPAHAECLNEWYKEHPTKCPACNTKIDPALIKEYIDKNIDLKTRSYTALNTFSLHAISGGLGAATLIAANTIPTLILNAPSLGIPLSMIALTWLPHILKYDQTEFLKDVAFGAIGAFFSVPLLSRSILIGTISLPIAAGIGAGTAAVIDGIRKKII